MATVYLARDVRLDRPVALKVLAEHFTGDEAFRDRFLREARLAARFIHPNVVQVYDVGEDARGPFIVMEYVEGDTLADELERRGRLPAGEVVDIGLQVCSALEAAHAEQLVHRDIKPQNILLQANGQVKIADFGIARSLAVTSQTALGTVLGTAGYLAPEQARATEVLPPATPPRPGRRRLAAVLALLVLLALGAILAVVLADSGGGHPAGAPTTQKTHPATTAPSTSAPTTTAGTTAVPPPPPTAQQLLANAQAAVSRAQASGQLDPGTAKDLSHRLDAVAQSLAKGN